MMMMVGYAMMTFCVVTKVVMGNSRVVVKVTVMGYAVIRVMMMNFCVMIMRMRYAMMMMGFAMMMVGYAMMMMMRCEMMMMVYCVMMMRMRYAMMVVGYCVIGMTDCGRYIWR